MPAWQPPGWAVVFFSVSLVSQCLIFKHTSFSCVALLEFLEDAEIVLTQTAAGTGLDELPLLVRAVEFASLAPTLY